MASLKERIVRGDIIVGVSVPITATKSQMEDILGKDDYAFIHADSQHSPYSEERLVQYCETAKEVGIPVQFRIKHPGHAYLVGNVLDLGPLGIEVPLVEDEATVDEAINWFYYPQVAKRSWGGAARYGVEERGDRLEYAEWWNENGILCIQMETLRAVTNARHLAKPGITCLTWGPADLSYDIEAHPHHPLQSVDDCLKHVIEQFEGTNIRMSFRNYDYKLRDYYKDMGVTVFMENPKP